MAYTWAKPIACPRVNGDESPLSNGTHVLDHTQVPVQWFHDNLGNLQWNGEPIHFPENLNVDVFGSVGDMNAPDSQGHPGAKQESPPPMDKDKATLVMMLGDKRKLLPFSGPYAATDEDKISCSIQNHSQLPSFTLEHKDQDENDPPVCHRMILYGNKSMHSVTYYSPDKVKTGVPKIPVPLELTKAANEERIMAVVFRFYSSSHKDRLLNSVVVLHGKDDADRKDRWRGNKDMIDTITRGTEIGFDIAVRYTFTVRDLTSRSSKRLWKANHLAYRH